MTDKQKIKQEIEKEIGNIKRYIYHPSLAGHSKRDMTVVYETLNKLLQFIDSLPEENHFEDKSEMVSEETTIVNDWQYGKDQDHAVIPAIHQRIEGFNVGDKVKIIIVKEVSNDNEI